MGSFDSVSFTCPKCGREIEKQSKSGRCEFDIFTEVSVPYSIAGDIIGETCICTHCDKEWEIGSFTPPLASLYLKAIS